MKCFTSFQYSFFYQCNLGGKLSSQTFSSFSSVSFVNGKTFKTSNSKMQKLRCSTASILLSTPFKLWDCIFHFFYFISLLPIIPITHPLYKNNNSNNNKKIIISDMNSLLFFHLSSFFHYLNYLLLPLFRHHLILTLPVSQRLPVFYFL